MYSLVGLYSQYCSEWLKKKSHSALLPREIYPVLATEHLQCYHHAVVPDGLRNSNNSFGETKRETEKQVSEKVSLDTCTPCKFPRLKSLETIRKIFFPVLNSVPFYLY